MWALTHWRPYLWGRHSTCCTDHQALTCCTTCKTRPICSPVEQFVFQITISPSNTCRENLMLCRIRCDVFLARWVENHFHPSRNLHLSPNPSRYVLSACNLDEIVPVEINRELFSSVISVFPVVDAAKWLDHQMKKIRQYFDCLANPTEARVPHQQSKSSMSNFFIHKGLFCRPYVPAHLTPFVINWWCRNR